MEPGDGEKIAGPESPASNISLPMQPVDVQEIQI